MSVLQDRSANAPAQVDDWWSVGQAVDRFLAGLQTRLPQVSCAISLILRPQRSMPDATQCSPV